MYIPLNKDQGTAMFFSTLEMEEYRDSLERVYGRMRILLDEDATMNEEFKQSLNRDLDAVFNLSGRLNLAVATERMNNG